MFLNGPKKFYHLKKIVVLIKDIFLLALPQCSVVAELSVACDLPNANISYEIAHSYC